MGGACVVDGLAAFLFPLDLNTNQPPARLDCSPPQTTSNNLNQPQPTHPNQPPPTNTPTPPPHPQDKKTEIYKRIVEEAAEARPGVLALMDEALARPDVALCICSAATKAGFEKVRGARACARPAAGLCSRKI